MSEKGSLLCLFKFMTIKIMKIMGKFIAVIHIITGAGLGCVKDCTVRATSTVTE